MDRLHGAADKLFVEIEHLDRILGEVDNSPSEDRVKLALSVAKRVRSQSTLLIRELAALRDKQATDPGGHKR